MVDRIGIVYIKNNIKLLGPIESCTVSDETRQDHDVIDLPHTVYIKNETVFS